MSDKENKYDFENNPDYKIENVVATVTLEITEKIDLLKMIKIKKKIFSCFGSNIVKEEL